MGCATSKLDELQAVALCHDRCAFLDEAIRRRFAFAEAHAAYLHSLKAVGLSLDQSFNLHFDAAAQCPASPVLDLPPQGKGKEPSSSRSMKTQNHLDSRSDSGSHLDFDSDSEDGDGSGSVFHHLDEPIQLQRPYETGGRFMNISYMERQTTPSLLHTQRPLSPENMRVGQSAASSSSYYPNYADSPNHNLHDNGYQIYSSALALASSLKPPPPPSPPRTSARDFLNPFGTFEDNYSAYAQSHDSPMAVREEEGIPDLEDEDDEVVKEVHGGRRLVDSKKGGYSKPLDDDDDEGWVTNKDFKNVVFKSAMDARNQGDFKGDLEVLKQIRIEFERASESGNELAKFLEVGKLPYKWKSNSHLVSFKMLNVPAMSLQHLMSKRSGNGDPTLMGVYHDVDLRSKVLSSTLHKLYLWETKLYEEVKVEEKMRVLHEKKSRKLKCMDDSGAESHKVEATNTRLKNLSTKIKMAIHVVDKISVKINTLRDEELWPQLNDFIKGLTRMWKSMLECHLNQCRAIKETKQLDTIALGKNSNDANFEHDLVYWTRGFSNWVGTQKGFVQSLNNWLTKCLIYVPEETPDGSPPFSPARISASRVFIVSHHWSQILDRISEKEVLDSMSDLASEVLPLWDQDETGMRGRIQKEIQSSRVFALEKNGVGPRGRFVNPSETTRGGGSVRASLQKVFEAMAAFSDNSVRAYGELLEWMDEHEKVS